MLDQKKPPKETARKKLKKKKKKKKPKSKSKIEAAARLVSGTSKSNSFSSVYEQQKKREGRGEG